MVVGEALATANLALTGAWLDARTDSETARLVALMHADAIFRTAAGDESCGAAAVAAVTDMAEKEPIETVALMSDGPFVTATLSTSQGLETWRITVTRGAVQSVVVDPEPLDR